MPLCICSTSFSPCAHGLTRRARGSLASVFIRLMKRGNFPKSRSYLENIVMITKAWPKSLCNYWKTLTLPRMCILWHVIILFYILNLAYSLFYLHAYVFTATNVYKNKRILLVISKRIKGVKCI